MEMKAPTLFTLKEALSAGLTRRDISKMVDNSELLRLAHGLYLNTKNKVSSEHIDFIAAQYKFGERSLIGGLSALFYHGLTDQPPQQVWVIVPPETRTIESKYRLIRTKGSLDLGIEKLDLFRISDINRTIAEAFKFAAKIGIRTAVSATVKAIKEKKTTLPQIMKVARELGYENAIRKHWETIAGMVETE